MSDISTPTQGDSPPIWRRAPRSDRPNGASLRMPSPFVSHNPPAVFRAPCPSMSRMARNVIINGPSPPEPAPIPRRAISPEGRPDYSVNTMVQIGRLHTFLAVLARKRGEEIHRSQELAREIQEMTWRTFSASPREYIHSVLRIPTSTYTWHEPQPARLFNDEWMQTRELCDHMRCRKAEVDEGIRRLEEQILGVAEILEAGLVEQERNTRLD